MIIDKPRIIPKPSQKLVNPDGTMDKAWYDWFRDWDAVQRKLVDSNNDYETRLQALEP